MSNKLMTAVKKKTNVTLTLNFLIILLTTTCFRTFFKINHGLRFSITLEAHNLTNSPRVDDIADSNEFIRING